MPQLEKREVTGLRQSPIDIRREEVVLQRDKRSLGNDLAENSPLNIDYSAIIGADGLTFENTGHGWKLNIPDDVAGQCPITGGPLGTDQYRLLQIHSHWGQDSNSGSEHTIDGKSYPCEIHLVHWNVTKYTSAEQAMECTSDGLAVVGVFVDISNEPSEPLARIIEHLDKIPFRGDKVPFENSNRLDLNQLVPTREAPKFWHYEGSLTTPPYSESVLWLVMEQPITAQEEQIAAFRKMNETDRNSSHAALVEENYREVQLLNKRQIVYFN